MSDLRRDTSRYVEQVMGLPVSLALRGRHRNDAEAARAWAAVVADLRRVDAMFSTYRADSWVSRVNRGEIPEDGGPPETVEVLARAARAEEESGGAFTVHLPRSDGRQLLDPSGVVKGWAVERTAAHLVALDATSFCICAGGDMLCGTDDADDDGWRIAVAHPFEATRSVAMVDIRDGAVATSGTSARGQHLLDGRTGRPAEGLAQVSVVAASLTGADIWATTAFALGTEAAAWLSRRPAHTVLVRPDGSAEVVTGQERSTAAQR